MKKLLICVELFYSSFEKLVVAKCVRTSQKFCLAVEIYWNSFDEKLFMKPKMLRLIICSFGHCPHNLFLVQTFRSRKVNFINTCITFSKLQHKQRFRLLPKTRFVPHSFQRLWCSCHTNEWHAACICQVQYTSLQLSCLCGEYANCNESRRDAFALWMVTQRYNSYQRKTWTLLKKLDVIPNYWVLESKLWFQLWKFVVNVCLQLA